MTATDSFRRQHKDILHIASEIGVLMERDALIASRADKLHGLFNKLAGQLIVHLAMEDKGLYPKLLYHRDDAIRTMAKRYFDEMGNLKQVFGDFMKRWGTKAAIEAAPRELKGEASTLFSALGTRISREDNELYVLLDQLGE